VRAALLSLAVLALAGCERPTNHTGERLAASGDVIALSGGEGGARNACFTCHGLDGDGDGVSVPRLAGLDAGYLQKQLDDYAADLRPDPTMTPIARRLDDKDRRAVAAYYAAMSPLRMSARPPGPAPSIYATACAVCHGAGGEGVGTANPALSGQPAAYTLDQLRRWKRTERRGDPRGVMTAAVAPLTEDQMRAIAAWLETRPASPRPDTAVASVSAGEAAAAGSAASHEARRPDR
jgi:cytochrome c553